MSLDAEMESQETLMVRAKNPRKSRLIQIGRLNLEHSMTSPPVMSRGRGLR